MHSSVQTPEISHLLQYDCYQAETALIDFAVIHGMDIRAEVIGIALLCGHIASRHQILGINKVGITRKSGKRLVRRISIAGGS